MVVIPQKRFAVVRVEGGTLVVAKLRPPAADPVIVVADPDQTARRLKAPVSITFSILSSESKE